MFTLYMGGEIKDTPKMKISSSQTQTHRHPRQLVCTPDNIDRHMLMMADGVLEDLLPGLDQGGGLSDPGQRV